jgi:hypothetical protein
LGGDRGSGVVAIGLDILLGTLLGGLGQLKVRLGGLQLLGG